MSTLRVNEITNETGTGSIIIPIGNTLKQEGLVVQVLQKQFFDSTSCAVSQTYITVTGSNLNITTKLDNSKILVMVSAQGYIDSGSGTNIGANRIINSTTTRLIGVDGASGDTWQGAANGGGTATSWNIKRELLDSPSMPAGTTIQYNMLLGRWSSAGTTYVNYPGYTGGSTITLMEIAP